MYTRLLTHDDGQDVIEYGLLLALIALGLIALMPGLGGQLGDAFRSWGDAVYDLWVPNAPGAP